MLGVAANLRNGDLLFARNGKWVNVFSGVHPPGGLYPAITTEGTKYTANFGAAPFRFPAPDDEYVPLLATHSQSEGQLGEEQAVLEAERGCAAEYGVFRWAGYIGVSFLVNLASLCDNS